MAETKKEIGILSEKPSEMTLVSDAKDSSSKELLFGVESGKEMALVGEKNSSASNSMDSEIKEMGLQPKSDAEISRSLSRSESATFEKNLGLSEDSDDKEHEIVEPTSYPSGLRFGLLTAAVCLTIGTVRISIL
jgi:hypothetical protein